MAPFRISNVAVLLTYSQIGETTKEDILYTLEERLPKFQYCIGEEQHQDGGRHIHCVLRFERKFDSKDSTIFDVSTFDTWHHPNIKKIQRGQANLQRSIDYVSKEDPTPLSSFPNTLTWSEITQNSATPDEFLENIKKNYPKDYCTNLQRYEYAASKLFPQTSPNDIPVGYQNDYEYPTLNIQTDFSKSTVIIGTPGCGKTSWAKDNAPKPALFIRHLDSLALIRPEHRSIIFDDLDFRHLPVSTQKYLVDYENLSEIHVRYKVAKIKPGIPRIFTANEYPFIDDTSIHADAINRRVNKIYLD
ncbi:Rep [uncultured virus]|uniref:Rep n=1 Tax=uncultured virus TaxID=340016 RepID=A0A2K9LSB7_9VIRU|nr:Rep [uncultured virus]